MIQKRVNDFTHLQINILHTILLDILVVETPIRLALILRYFCQNIDNRTLDYYLEQENALTIYASWYQDPVK